MNVPAGIQPGPAPAKATGGFGCRDFFTVVSNTEVPTGEASLLYELVPTGEPDFAAGRACRPWPAVHRQSWVVAVLLTCRTTSPVTGPITLLDRC
jgi:hypothetical protein